MNMHVHESIEEQIHKHVDRTGSGSEQCSGRVQNSSVSAGKNLDLIDEKYIKISPEGSCTFNNDQEMQLDIQKLDNCLDRLEYTQFVIFNWLKKNAYLFSSIVLYLLVGLISSYLALCLRTSIHGSIPLLVFAGLLFILIAWILISKLHGAQIVTWYHNKVEPRLCHGWKYARWVLYGAILVGFGIFLGLDVGRRNPRHLISLSGIIFFLVICFLSSNNHSQIPWRTVYCGVVVQIVLGLAVLRWNPGASAIEWLANQITAFIGYGQSGARVVFGESFEDHSFAMALMPMITWFMAITNVLQYFGIIQFVIKLLGEILHFFVGTSPAEAFVAAANIFLGPEAAILMIRSMADSFTSSQLHTFMTCGLACIDAGLFPVFQSFGIPVRHLLSASCMSAPAALVISKMMYPDKIDESTEQKRLKLHKLKAMNCWDAFCQGAVDSVPLIADILAFLMTIISLVAFVNTNLTWFGDRAGIDNLTMQKIISYILMPVTYLMGVIWEDCGEVGGLIGTKMIVNEFVAYVDLAQLIQNREQGLEPSISPRSETIAAFALCGFSNLGTMGIMIAFLSSIAPQKTGDISQMALRALVGSNIACFMTACVAGLLLE